jgi:DNA repair exonuclease SbcCD nuclease subunit
MRAIKFEGDRIPLVYTTDWHISNKAPGRRRDNYRETILKKLEFVRQLTQKLNGVAICGGDVFHVKNPKSPANSFGLTEALIQKLKSFPYNLVMGAVGNHDISYDDMATLPDQPLGILMAAGVYHNLVDEPVMLYNDSVRILVESFPYEEGENTLQRLLVQGVKPKDNYDYRIGVVHAFGESGNGGTLFGAVKIGYNQVKHLNYDFLLWGHDHSRKETETVGNITHINLGSLARAAFNTDEVDRKVVAMVLSFSKEGVKGKEVEIPVDPLDSVFTTADVAFNKVEKQEEISDFFSSMNEQVEEIGTSDPREVLKTLCPKDEPEILNLSLEYCEL